MADETRAAQPVDLQNYDGGRLKKLIADLCQSSPLMFCSKILQQINMSYHSCMYTTMSYCTLLHCDNFLGFGNPKVVLEYVQKQDRTIVSINDIIDIRVNNYVLATLI